MEQNGLVTEDREVADMRLLALLRELARDHGRKKAAAMLGVDRRTLDAGLDEGVLSRRMRRALDRALQSGLGAVAEEQRERNQRLEERVAEMEGSVEGLAGEMRRRLAGIEGAVEALRRDDGVWTGAGQAGAGPSQPEVGASPQDEKPRPKFRERRDYPDLVTREPADDDEDVFGEAWPLIDEWRELKNTHPIKGKGLAWLTVEERRLTLELELLEEHGMTLPPEKQPLRGLDRSGQTSWRRSALSDTRIERKRAEFLHRLTFGLFWR